MGYLRPQSMSKGQAFRRAQAMAKDHNRPAYVYYDTGNRGYQAFSDPATIGELEHLDLVLISEVTAKKATKETP